MSNAKACLGSLFPNLDELRPNELAEGEVFTAIVRHHELGRVERETGAKLAAWDACYSCEQYRSCYEFSMAKLFLQVATKLCS